MNVTVKGKQIDVGDALRDYVSDNLGQSVKKYFPNTVDGQVVFSRDAHLFTADIQLNVGRGLVLHSHGEAGEAYPAFDAGLEKLSRQLQRYKKRLVEHNRHETKVEEVQAPSYVIEMKDEDKAANDQPVVIAEMQTGILTLTVSEAVMHLDLAGVPALMFKNIGHGGYNMVYRRADGHIGWIDPAGNAKSRA